MVVETILHGIKVFKVFTNTLNWQKIILLIFFMIYSNTYKIRIIRFMHLLSVYYAYVKCHCHYSYLLLYEQTQYSTEDNEAESVSFFFR